jgi:tellurite methyltransferase
MTTGGYWNNYYKGGTPVSAPQVPSQFAAFVVSELSGQNTKIIDFGCGNGRDALFFARHGYSVLGVDGSQTAVDNCQQQNVEGAGFICSAIDNPDLAEQVLKTLPDDDRDILVYARFFIHAIDREAQEKFLKTCRKIVETGGRVAFEFRTDRDQNQTKVTAAHYRRFVSPLEFMEDVSAAGFKVRYFVEGFGYAKYKEDDAHVARFILEPV